MQSQLKANSLAVRFRMSAIVDDRKIPADRLLMAARTIVDSVRQESRITGTERLIRVETEDQSETISLAAARKLMERAAQANRFLEVEVKPVEETDEDEADGSVPRQHKLDSLSRLSKREILAHL